VGDPQILILDESTSALDVATRDQLFAVIHARTVRQRTVIFISHRMDEIEEIADRITVLRSGRSVATVDRGQASSAELVRLMSGADTLTALADRSATPADAGSTVLQAQRIRLGADTPAIDFSLFGWRDRRTGRPRGPRPGRIPENAVDRRRRRRGRAPR
jgi:ABC-type sugar transport system ATPase subunit